MAYRLTEGAEGQLARLLSESLRRFGLDAMERYRLLLLTTMDFLGSQPRPAGSTAIERLPGVRVYPTRLSRMRISPERRVRSPRHIVIYRLAPGDGVEILGFAHDRMLLSRAARAALRRTDPT